MQNLIRLLLMMLLVLPSTVLPSDEIPAHLRLNQLPVRGVDRFGKDQIFGTSQAVRVDGLSLLHTSQYLPSGRSLAGDIATQADDVLRQIREDLSNKCDKSGDVFDVVKLNIYVTSVVEPATIRDVLVRNFLSNRKPAVSIVQTRLSRTGAVVAMDAVAAECPRFGTTFGLGSPCFNHFSGGSAPITAIPSGQRVYISGQAEKGANLREATHKTLLGLQSTLKSLGADLNRVAQVKCFLTPMSDVALADQAIREFFGKEIRVPCVFVEWQSNLPIEIEMIAWVPPNSPAEKKRQLTAPKEPLEFITPPGMSSSPVFCRVVRINDPRTIYFSSLFAEDTSDSIDQVTQVFDLLDRIVIARASSLQDLVKATYYVCDNDTSTKLNEVRPKFYHPQRPPAASKAQVVGVGLLGRTFMLDMIAVPMR